MPNIYIQTGVQNLIKRAVVEATKATKRPVKQQEVIKLLIYKGFSEMTAEKWRQELQDESPK